MTRRRNRKPNMTAVEKWQICQMYQDGVKLVAIAAHFGRALSTISAVVKDGGVPRRWGPWKDGGRGDEKSC